MAYITNEIKTVTGTDITINDSDQKFINNLTLQGNTTQETTPTPDSPIPINVVSGIQEVIVEGKNLCDGINQLVYLNNATTQCGIANNNSGLYIKVYGGNYTISTTTTQTRYRVGCSINIPPSSGTTTAYNGQNKDGTDNSITIDTTGYNYLIVNATDLSSIQIEKSSTASEYEEYREKSYEINLGDIELCKIGDYQDFIKKGTRKNLLPYPYTQGTITNNGITFTVNEDGTILVNGTASGGNASIKLLGNYQVDNQKTIPGKYLYGGTSAVRLRAMHNENNTYTTLANDTGTGAEIDLSTYNTGYIELIVYNGTTVNNQTIKPMVLNSLEDTTYEPYVYKDKWYIEKNINKVVLNGSENWGLSQTQTNTLRFGNITILQNGLNTNELKIISNTFKNGTSAGDNTDNEHIRSATRGYPTYLFILINKTRLATQDVAGFKSWLSTHNTTVYYILNTPTYTEITDSELIEQLNAPRLFEGLNNVSVSSADLGNPIKLSYYSTDNDYYDAVYSQDDRNDLKIWFNDVELENAPIKCEKITRTARILPNDGNKVFSLDNFISTSLEVILHNVDIDDIQDQVKISIGTLVDAQNNTYQYIPLGVFNIQDTPTNDNGKITLKLRDNRVKFDFNYNAQPLIEANGGTASKKQILDDICLQAGVKNNITSFSGDNDLVGIYDNTITATTYVSYLMEQAGLIPVIDREGNLKAIDLSELYVWKIPLSILETGFQIGEPYKIDRVVYESGIIKYETSNDETLDTLYIDASNPYITDQEQVNYILEKLQNFKIDSVITKNVLGNPAIDPYDIIRIYNDLDNSNDTIFETLANTTYTYNGKHRDIFDTQIGKEQRTENVTLKSESTFQKYAKALIDNIEGEITLQVGQVSGDLTALNKQLYGDEDAGTQGDIDILSSQITQKADAIEFDIYKGKVDDIETNGVDKVQTTSVLINNDGLSVATNTSKISTQITNNSFEIKNSGGNTLAFFGYNENEGISKAEMDNLTVTNYFIAGVHRVETYEESGEQRTGWFYIGG